MQGHLLIELYRIEITGKPTNARRAIRLLIELYRIEILGLGLQGIVTFPFNRTL